MHATSDRRPLADLCVRARLDRLSSIAALVVVDMSRWHNTLPHGGVSAAKLNAFAAEPVETGSRSTSQSKISLKRRRALKVQLSVP
jgi:hypothetical protein